MTKRIFAAALALLAICVWLPAAGLSLREGDDGPVGSTFEDFCAPYITEGGLPSTTEFYTRAEMADERITVINMWDAACLFCRLELPYFQQVSEEYAARGVRVVGAVSTRMGSTYAAAYGYILEFGLTYTNVIPDRMMEKVIFINANTPQTFFVDPSGTVVDHIQGATTYEELSARLEALLAVAGDADCSGTLTFTDVSAVYAYALGLSTLSEQGAKNADFDGDGAVTFNDISLIYRTLIG